jgi:hypothetical protein
MFSWCLTLHVANAWRDLTIQSFGFDPTGQGTPAVADGRHTGNYAGQLMSLPQHMGDLIFPSQAGHLAMRTSLPSSSLSTSSTNGFLQVSHCTLTVMLHVAH